MSTSNPTLLTQSTRFRPPATRSQSRSPSRSPVRKAEFTAQEIDPLLGNLSPNSTLKALSLTDALGTKQSKDADILTRSIAETSTGERAYGIRAAVAAQKLREWHAEVVGWKWPSKRDRRLGRGFEPRPSAPSPEKTISPNAKCKEYFGSLPATVVAQHEERIEQIKDGLEALGVDELKEHVLSAHNPSRARKQTTNGTHHGLVQLSDFTAVITHTMLQALPYLSKLTALLHDWETRVIILKQVPRLLRQLEEAETAVESASDNVCARRTSGLLTRARFEHKRVVLGHDVSLLGATFDKLLDLLEGREDSLPEAWIERMDKLEASFAQWIVEAERRVLYNEWMEQNRTSVPEPHSAEEASKPIDSTILTSDIVLCANGQVHNSSGWDKRFTKVHPVGVKHEQLPIEDTVISQLAKIDKQKSSSPAAPESSQIPSAVEAGPVASISTARRDGGSTLADSRLPVNTTGAVDLASAPQRVEEQLLKMISREPEAFRTPPNPPFDEKTLPLTAPVHQLEEETHTPSKLGAPAVDNVQISGAREGPSEPASTWTVQTRKQEHSSPRSSESAPVKPDPEYANQHYSLPPDNEDSSLLNRPDIKHPLGYNLPETDNRREVSRMSMAESVMSEALSDLSNVEIVNATTAAVLGSPKVVSHSFRASRDDLSGGFAEARPRASSMHLSRQDMALIDPAGGGHRRTASVSLNKMSPCFSMPIKASDTVTDGEDDGDDRSECPVPITDPSATEPVKAHCTVIPQASPTSVEKIPSLRIRSIIVRRGDNSSSPAVSPISPLAANEAHGVAISPQDVSPLEVVSSTYASKKSPQGDYFEAVGRMEESSPVASTGSFKDPNVEHDHTDPPSVPRRSSRRLSRAPSAILGLTLPGGTQDLALPTDSHHGTQDVDEAGQTFSSPHSPSKVDDHNKLRTPLKGKPKDHEDLLEAKIQSLLSHIPGRIRLVSDSDSESPPHPSTTSSSRSQSPIPSIILSPVKPKRRVPPNNSGDAASDVRIFHLTRSTESRNTPPVRLLVRLVGEHGERVMVRVGGGWADLGDYLRDYSSHHSKRGLNNVQFELASLPVGGQKDSKDRRVIPLGPELISKAMSAGHPLSKFRSPISPRPGSALGQHPSADTPFGTVKPTRRQRSTSAIASQGLGVPNLSSTCPAQALGSDADSVRTTWEAPPSPSTRQAQTHHPYMGDDLLMNGQSQQPTAAASFSSVQTPTCTDQQTLATAHMTPLSSHQQRQDRTSLDQTNPSTPSRSTGRVSGSGRSSHPAASRMSPDPGHGDRGGDGDASGDGAPAPTIGGAYSSPPTTGGRPGTASAKSRISSLGDVGVGGIRRVFFRRKMAA